MGLLVDGVWQDRWYDTDKTGGRFKRTLAKYRNWVTPDGAPGPTGEGGFGAEPGRYHLYVSPACPWSHRAMIYRVLKKLEPIIGMSIVDFHMGEHGWEFSEREGATLDTVNGANYLYEVYLKANPHYTGRVTVPTLWDKKKNTIVSNESSDIIRMFDAAFDKFTNARIDSRPPELVGEIDALNAQIYETVNDGVYRTGFATSQAAYEEAFAALFATLDELDKRLATRRYLVGPKPTEADWRLFPTLVRFDAVYYSHFKCNLRRIIDYANLSGYTRDLYQYPGVAETVNMRHIKGHYYTSHKTINPTGIVPVGPLLDFTAPHGRERLGVTIPPR
jgi:putative glutathione S-transferase